MKEIDLGKSVYALTEMYPELIPLLKEEGFLGVANPVTRHTLGRITTIPDGCQKQGKFLQDVTEVLKAAGFTVT
ncbi:DUF1858 domain-containing protein [Chloroflexota bacterium]